MAQLRVMGMMMAVGGEQQAQGAGHRLPSSAGEGSPETRGESSPGIPVPGGSASNS